MQAVNITLVLGQHLSSVKGTWCFKVDPVAWNCATAEAGMYCRSESYASPARDLTESLNWAPECTIQFFVFI
jgi:hypothetical protein